MNNENEQIRKIEMEMEKLLNDNLETTIKPKRFRNKTTGETVTRFSILEINNFEEIL